MRCFWWSFLMRMMIFCFYVFETMTLPKVCRGPISGCALVAGPACVAQALWAAFQSLQTWGAVETERHHVGRRGFTNSWDYWPLASQLLSSSLPLAANPSPWTLPWAISLRQAHQHAGMGGLDCILTLGNFHLSNSLGLLVFGCLGIQEIFSKRLRFTPPTNKYKTYWRTALPVDLGYQGTIRSSSLGNMNYCLMFADLQPLELWKKITNPTQAYQHLQLQQPQFWNFREQPCFQK